MMTEQRCTVCGAESDGMYFCKACTHGVIVPRWLVDVALGSMDTEIAQEEVLARSGIPRYVKRYEKLKEDRATLERLRHQGKEK